MRKKGDLSYFEHGVVVGARRAGLRISETVDLLEFSHTTISNVYREWSKKQKIFSVWQFCGLKGLVTGQRRMSSLVPDDTDTTVTKITTHYHQGNAISECITYRLTKAGQ